MGGGGDCKEFNFNITKAKKKNTQALILKKFGRNKKKKKKT